MVTLVGLNGGVPASDIGEYVITLRGVANDVLPGVLVTLDFSNTTDARLGTDQPDAEALFDCAASQLSKVTDAQGQIRFKLVGRGTGVYSLGAAGCFAGVLVGDVLVSPIQVTVYDLDGQSGVSGGDLSVFLTEFARGNTSWALDYDESGGVGGGDLAMWLTAFGAGTQTSSCAAVCP